MESLYWFLDQTHIVVTGITGLAFLVTRSPHVAYFIVGALVCNTFAKLSKKVIRQDRPYTTVPAAAGTSPSPPPGSSPSARHPKKVKKTYGMPSTHSTSIAFFMTYIVLSLPPFQRSRPTRSASVDGAMLLGTLGWGGAIMWSRVYLGYHTKAQVMVGGLIGLVGGIAWRAVWDGYVLPNGLDGWMQHVVDRAFALVGQ